MIKILHETLQFDQLATGTAWAGFLQDNFEVDAPVSLLILIGMLLFTAFYTTISGLWGVLVTDLFQFVLKMGMVILAGDFGGQRGRRHRCAEDAKSRRSMRPAGKPVRGWISFRRSIRRGCR